MGKVTVRAEGASVSFPNGGPRTKPAKRGEIKGWTPAMARRMLQFLWSVDVSELTGTGWALTLTMGGQPETADEWGSARDVMVQWLRDQPGYERHQWVTEWTRNGRPHLHLCAYLDTAPEAAALHWMKVSRSHGWDAGWKSQHVEQLHDEVGWLKYVAKHSARGVDHYQRDSPPAGWEKTGRLWGKGGEWPTIEPESFYLTGAQTWQYMGLFKSWQAARMRAEGVEESVIHAYESAPLVPPNGGGPRGLSGWIPQHEAVRLLMQVTEYPDGV